ncbi:YihY/virulence factor BrkB family protein [Gulosibacter chungangensis]|uniref:YihY/virulence factor BrkB family protein n=1 Tax=Gulosibacter chungangensis TaxID=979746 RepID=A0A7J5BEW2_9MICO|nr:YihY/virulence factor BrkB family protein [Gulosibacter chungangensis]KAB1644797.1 YihY/virulence factor BrkB family protein [Gulosibacter chungangensis]
MSDNREHELSTARATIFPPYPNVEEDAGLGKKLGAFVQWVQATRPLRAIQHWTARRGGTLAGGMAYSGLFSAFAALLVFFSVAGLVLAKNEDLLLRIIDSIAESVPGLIGETGVISTDTLLSLETTASFTAAGILALVSTLWTALNFLNGARLSIRAMFDLPTKTERSFVKMKLVDLLLLVLFGVGLAISAVLTAASYGVVAWLLRDVLHLEISGFVNGVIGFGSIIITLLFDALVVAAMLRTLSEVRIPLNTLWQAALLGGIAITVLKQLGSLLLGGASSNPLLATFATLIGVLIFFNFICMVLLISAAWAKVTMDDVGQAPRLLTAEEADAIASVTELKARRERLAADRIRVLEELDATPRGKRRKLRREYEKIVQEQEALEQEALEQRLGYDPTEAHAHRNGIDPDDVQIRR